MTSDSVVYFISGHIDVTQDFFDRHYKDKIIEAALNPNSKFVIGSAPGVDYLAQKLLISLLENEPNGLERITIYYKGDKPETDIDSRLRTMGGFASHNKKDEAMTMASDIDIAYVRTLEESKELYGEKFDPKKISGTQRNIERRIKMNNKK